MRREDSSVDELASPLDGIGMLVATGVVKTSTELELEAVGEVDEPPPLE
jgi:hypothetical protein